MVRQVSGSLAWDASLVVCVVLLLPELPPPLSTGFVRFGLRAALEHSIHRFLHRWPHRLLHRRLVGPLEAQVLEELSLDRPSFTGPGVSPKHVVHERQTSATRPSGEILAGRFEEFLV